MFEANGVFEVSLIGNSMLPMTKRTQDLFALAQNVPAHEIGTLQQDLQTCRSPDQIAKVVEIFLNRGLTDELQTRNEMFKAFLGLHLAYDTDHFRANFDGTGESVAVSTQALAFAWYLDFLSLLSWFVADLTADSRHAVFGR